jgi:hypothetical protein
MQKLKAYANKSRNGGKMRRDYIKPLILELLGIESDLETKLRKLVEMK